MKHYKKYILSLFVCLGILNLGAQEQSSSAFSLQQAIDYALKNSPSYLNAELDQQSAEHKRKEVAGIGYPQISGSADIKNYIEIPTSLIPGDFVGMPAGSFIPVKFGTKYQATAGLSASQIIFSSDYIFGLKASKEFINLSRISVARSKNDLAAQVSKAYYNVIINKDRIKLLDANVAMLKQVYDNTKAMNEQGFVELIDVERIEVQFNNLISEKEKVERMMSISETLLKFQMGFKLGDQIQLTDSLNASSLVFEELGSGKVDISQRPDYLLLNSQQQLLNIDAKRLQWGYLPTLAAYGSYQYNTQRNEADFFSADKTNPTKQWFKIALIGATLNLNIFDGFQRHNRIQQAKIAALKNQNNITNIELAGELEATMASITYGNAYRTLLNQKRNMELAIHVYEVSRKKYQEGVGSNIEILTAETSLKEAQTNYYNAVYDMIVAKIDYQKATGTLIK